MAGTKSKTARAGRWNPSWLWICCAGVIGHPGCTLTSDIGDLHAAAGGATAGGSGGAGMSEAPDASSSSRGGSSGGETSGAGGAGAAGEGAGAPMSTDAGADAGLSDCTQARFSSGTETTEFLLCAEPRSWASAVVHCSELGFTLARIDDEVEYEWLLEQAKSLDMDVFWTGGRDREQTATWTWPDGTVLWQGDALCPEESVEFGSSCYFLTPDGPFDSLIDNCEPAGIVAIESEQENKFVQGLMGSKTNELWLGGSDASQERVWVWLSTGEVFWDNAAIAGVFNAFNTDPHVESEDCVYMNSDGSWDDGACGAGGRPLVCEGKLERGEGEPFSAWLPGEPSVPASCIASTTGSDGERAGFETLSCSGRELPYVCRN